MLVRQTTLVRACFKESFHDVYCVREPVMFEAIEELPGDQMGVRLVFASNMKEVSHFLVPADGKSFRESGNGAASLPLSRTVDRQGHKEVTDAGSDHPGAGGTRP